MDFKNAFITLWGDHIAECLSKYSPELLNICTACYSSPSFLTLGDSILRSDKGLQRKIY